MALQIDGRVGPCEAAPLGRGSSSSSRDISSTGTVTCRSSRLGSDASTTVTWRYWGAAVVTSKSSRRSEGAASRAAAALLPVPAEAPPRKRATSSNGRCVAERPIRWRRCSQRSSSRSSERARCDPRLVGTTAWISSITTVSIDRNRSRAFEVRSRYKDSGVVINMSEGRRRNRARSAAGVSPVRMATVGSWNSTPERWAACAMPTSGDCRLRSTSTASALIGET